MDRRDWQAQDGGQVCGDGRDHVKLVLKTGKKREIELKQLSAADQKYVESFDAENPFKDAEDGDDPFKPAAEGEGEEEMADGKTKAVTVDWNDSEAILLEAPSEEWVATVAAHPGLGKKPKTVALPQKSNFHEGLVGLVVSDVAKKAIVCYRLGREETDANVRLVVCDLQTGKTGSIASAQALMSPIALHDDGKQVLMRHDGFGSGNQERLELWTIKGKAVQKTLSWIPYEDPKWRPNQDVAWAEFIDADQLLTSGRIGRVALWDLKTAKPLWHFETVDGASPCLSGDRKTIGFCNGERVGLFDIAERKVLALSATPDKLTWPVMSFSPSGQRMACVAQSRVLVWDTTNGKLLFDFETPGLHIFGPASFPDDNFLFCGGKFIIELENQLKLWEYTGAEQWKTVGNLTLAAVGAHNGPGALLSLDLPHKEARDLLAKALKQPDLFVFREGSTVKLDVSGVPAADQDHVREALTKKLTDMKCKIADSGTIALVAAVTGPKERTVSYRSSGDYKVQEYFTELRFDYQGKVAWSSSSTNIPGFLMLQKGENIEGVLRKASEKPAISFYDGVILPKFLQNPSGAQGAAGRQTIGGSQITPSGLK